MEPARVAPRHIRKIGSALEFPPGLFGLSTGRRTRIRDLLPCRAGTVHSSRNHHGYFDQGHAPALRPAQRRLLKFDQSIDFLFGWLFDRRLDYLLKVARDNDSALKFPSKVVHCLPLVSEILLEALLRTAVCL